MSAFPAVDSYQQADSAQVAGIARAHCLDCCSGQGLRDLVRARVQVHHPGSTFAVAVGWGEDRGYGKQSYCWVGHTRLGNPVFVWEPCYRCYRVADYWAYVSDCCEDRGCFRVGVGNFVVGDLRLVLEAGKAFVRVDYLLALMLESQVRGFWLTHFEC